MNQPDPQEEPVPGSADSGAQPGESAGAHGGRTSPDATAGERPGADLPEAAGGEPDDGGGALPSWAVSIPPDSPAPFSGDPQPTAADPQPTVAESQPTVADAGPAVSAERPTETREPVPQAGAEQSPGAADGVSPADAPPPADPAPAEAPPSPWAGAAEQTFGAPPPLEAQRGDLFATLQSFFPEDRPELLIGAAFLAGYLFAQLLKRLVR